MTSKKAELLREKLAELSLEQRALVSAGAWAAAALGRPRLRDLVCEFLEKSWRQLQRDASTVLAQKPPKKMPVSAKVQERRKLIKKLAKKTWTDAKKVKHPSHPSAQSIVDALPDEFKCCRQQVHRHCIAMKLVSRVRRKVPTRDPDVLKERVRFARSVLRWPIEKVNRIVFSDETIKNANDYTARCMYVELEHAQEQLLPRQNTKPWNIASVQVWGAVGIGYKSKLVLFPRKNDDDNKGWRLNAERYKRRCLMPIMADLREKRRIWQQDGARAHTAHSIRKYLDNKQVECIKKWPAYSPDLSPIELVWALLQRRVSKRYPHTQEEIERMIVEEWDKITQSEIDEICGSFRERLKECVRLKGNCVSK